MPITETLSVSPLSRHLTKDCGRL